MRYLLAVMLGLHGVAHLVGFAVAWHMIATPEVHYKTTVLRGLVDIGDAGTQFVGLIWLATALACVGAGALVWEGVAWSMSLTTGVLLFSLALCVTALPEARIGVLVNVVLLVAVLMPRLATTVGLF